jgi:hypothetical protein
VSQVKMQVAWGVGTDVLDYRALWHHAVDSSGKAFEGTALC